MSPPPEVTESHPGWTGTCQVTKNDIDAAGRSLPTEKIEEAARAAMQAWADDPQCRWWLPGDNVQVSLAGDFNVQDSVALKVHVPSRFFRRLVPTEEKL